jgi:hypothetical protein
MQDRLKKYDKNLVLSKKLNWLIEIERKSQFIKKQKYIALSITNQVPWRWILDKIRSMDSRRIDFFQKTIHNKLLDRYKKSSDRRMHEEVARYIINWEQFVN